MSLLKALNGHNKVNPKDFHVDPRTGFVPPLMPLQRLPTEWDAWESALDAAKANRFKPAEGLPLLNEQERIADEEGARSWRKSVAKVNR